MFSNYNGHDDNIFALAWSPDGQIIASGGRDCSIQLWKPVSGELASLFQCSILKADHSMQNAAFDPPTRSNRRECTPQIRKCLVDLHQGHHDCVLSLAWSPDG